MEGKRRPNRPQALLRATKSALTPAALKNVSMTRVAASMERLRLQGGKPAALRLGRSLTAQLPNSGQAHRYLIRVLLTEPVSAADVSEARVSAEIMLTTYEDAGVSALYADVLIAQHRLGIDQPDLRSAVVTFATVAPQRRLGAVRKVLVYLLGRDADALVVEISELLARHLGQNGYLELAHEMILRTGQVDVARRLIEDHEGELDPPERRSRLEVAMLTADGDLAVARRALEAERPRRHARYSRQYLAVLAGLGDAAGIIAYLDGTAHGLEDPELAIHRFDALALLGETEEALGLVEEALGEHPRNGALFQRYRDLLVEIGEPARIDDVVLQLTSVSTTMDEQLDVISAQLFDLDRIDEILEMAGDPQLSWKVGPIGHYNFARAHYVRRQFDEAEVAIDRLAGTVRDWEGEKLRSRIMFERGDFESALEHRRRHRRSGPPLDEVEYHVRLHERDYDAAFGMYVAEEDERRLSAVFGERAEVRSSFPPVARRAVIVQGGPGDEIQLASTYADLCSRGGLVVTCDPRLESLLRRSFPDVDLVPVTRAMSRRHFGFLRDGRPRRAANELYDLLTHDAWLRVDSCDRVALGRSLQQLSVRPGGGAPYGAYLTPDPALVESMRERLRGDRPTIGLVWRSEFNDAMRSIHYLTVDELAPLATVDAQFVCLQHDATPDERRRLEQLFPGRVTYLDDLDMRDDFEIAAAMVAGLDVVMGVGTTIVELAGAVGTPAVLVQPTLFGAWRSTDEHGSDYWYRSARVAAVSDPTDRSACVVSAASTARELLTVSAPPIP